MLKCVSVGCSLVLILFQLCYFRKLATLTIIVIADVKNVLLINFPKNDVCHVLFFKLRNAFLQVCNMVDSCLKHLKLRYLHR